MQGKIIEISGRQFVNAATLAALLDLHKRTILIWATEHGMPVISVGNMRLFDLADISDWFNKHKLVSKAQTVGKADKRRHTA
jgi:excisionase family DNA binding protein